MEIIAPLMAIGIMIYGLMLMSRGPTFANKMVSRALSRGGRLAKRWAGQLLRLMWRWQWALNRALARGLWWLVRRTGQIIRDAWRRYPHASGLFWGALAGVIGKALV